MPKKADLSAPTEARPDLEADKAELLATANRARNPDQRDRGARLAGGAGTPRRCPPHSKPPW
jgi:hypothetical protein